MKDSDSSQRRGRFSFVAAVAVALAAALLGPGVFGWPAVGDCRPYGALTYFGAPVPVGTRLQARIQGVVVAEDAVTTLGRYALVIPPDNPLTTTRDGWRLDDRIGVWADDHEARPDFAAFDGPRQIDLVISSITLDVRKSTWGKIKALFR